MKFWKSILLAGVLAFTSFLSAQAQTLAEKEKQWQSCEAAHYSGPREGRRNYTLDNYLWVVTPDFAKRFCMPEHMISHELLGAEAIAFRMTDGADMDRCGVDNQGKHHCTRQSRASFEIYLPQTLNLPAANPDVRFYESRRNTTEWLFSGNQERVSRSQRYIKNLYTPPPGTVPRFTNSFAHPDRGYTFGLWFTPNGSILWPTASLFEVGFRESVVSGMDMLIIENNLGMHFGFELKHYKANNIKTGDPAGKYVIVMNKRDSATINKNDKRIPHDFEHIIYLPHAFAMQVRDTAMKGGASSFTDFVNVFQQR